jgi:hypothetical protein
MSNESTAVTLETNQGTNPEISQEMNPDKASYAAIHSEQAKMQRFLLWMEEQGATFPHVKVHVDEDGSREMRATTSIPMGGLVLHIPTPMIIAAESARDSRIGREIAKSSATLGNYVYIAAFLLHAKRESGHLKPYLDILPTSYDSVPLLYDEARFAELQGVHMLPFIRNQIAWLDYEYNALKACLPEDMQFTREEYAWAKCVVMTRVHTVQFGDAQSSVAMVPLADLPNHSDDANVLWCPQSATGFTYTALRKIEAGEALTISYGRRSNGVLFNVYGFCLNDNPKREVDIEFPDMPDDHPCADHARRFGSARDGKRVFMVTDQCDDTTVREALTFARLSQLDKAPWPIAEGGAGAPEAIPLNHQNEIKALAMLADACEQRMTQFATTIEEDEALLAQGGLPYWHECAVRVRYEEKCVLRYLREFAQAATPVLQHTATAEKFFGYFHDSARLLWRKTV